MIPKSIVSLLFLLFCFGFYTCKSDNEVDRTDELVPITEHALFDSIYGELSAQDQYYQHFLVEIPATYQADMDSLSKWLISFQPGGVGFIDWSEDSLLKLKKKLDTTISVQPLYFANFYTYINLPVYPYWDVNTKNCNPKWTQVFSNGHIGLVDLNDQSQRNELRTAWTENWTKETGTQFISHHLCDTNVAADFERFRSILKSSDHLLELNLSHFDTVALNRFRMIYKYQGQYIVNVNMDAINTQLKGGADFVRVRLSPNQSAPIPFSKWQVNEQERAAFDQSTQRILSMKSKLNCNSGYNQMAEQKESVRLNFSVQSCALLNNESGVLPLSAGAHFFSRDNFSIDANLKKENGFKSSQDDLMNILQIAKKDGVKIVLLPDTLSTTQVGEIKKVTKNQETVFCFSNPGQYVLLKETPNLVFLHPTLREKENTNLLVQLFTQQLNLDGDFSYNNSVVKGVKIEKNKLARVSPVFCGLSTDTLKKIDYAASSAINGQAFPGCQILLEKDGYIFYDKSFGTYTYEDTALISPESMYDVASLTKVVATTMVGMLLYDQGAYKLTDSLKDYLPDSLSKSLRFPSTIRNITFQELFTHQSGLPAGFPVINYMQYTNAEVGRLDRYYCDKPDSVYSIEVAENFFLEECYTDSMWLRLNQMWLDPSKQYKYSDVNMNTLYFVFKSILHNNPEKYGFKLKKNEQKTRDLFVELLYTKIYNELSMAHTKYKPLQHYPKNTIVPTENERFWRKQLLQGHVHDPNAALYGGIAGNAGIFSTSNDLAILCEMLRQKGMYAGKRFFKSETVEKFTSAQPNSFRGLGFNKPSMNTSAFGCAHSAPQATYGHTGFTGTCFWVDPINNISFVFLSNRVYPQVNNRIYQYGIRRTIHQLAYDSRMFIEE